MEFGLDVVKDPVARYLGNMLFPSIKRKVMAGLVIEFLFEAGSAHKLSIRDYIEERYGKIRLRNLETLLTAMKKKGIIVDRQLKKPVQRTEWRFSREFRNFVEDAFERVKKLKRLGVL